MARQHVWEKKVAPVGAEATQGTGFRQGAGLLEVLRRMNAAGPSASPETPITKLRKRVAVAYPGRSLSHQCLRDNKEQAEHTQFSRNIS